MARKQQKKNILQRRKKVNFHLDMQDYLELQKSARWQGLSMSALITKMIRMGLCSREAILKHSIRETQATMDMLHAEYRRLQETKEDIIAEKMLESSK